MTNMKSILQFAANLQKAKESVPAMLRPANDMQHAGLAKATRHSLTLEVSMEEPIIDYPSIIVRKGSDSHPLTARIFAPAQSKHGDYSCAVELLGVDAAISTSILGIDRAQAVCLAINFLTETIINSSEWGNGEITSDDGSDVQFLRAHYEQK